MSVTYYCESNASHAVLNSCY